MWAISVSLLLATGCSSGSIPGRPAVSRQDSVISTPPPSAGKAGFILSGYLTGAGEESESGETTSAIRHTITVSWGSPKPVNQSDVLVVDSTALVFGANEDPSTTAAEKIEAIKRYLTNPSEVHAISVSYEASSNAGSSSATEEGYPYSVAKKIVIAPPK